MKIMFFYQEGLNLINGPDRPRIRVVYPDGKVQYKYLESHWDSFRDVCWGNFKVNKKIGEYSQFKDTKTALKEMAKFDKKSGYKKAIFLGYL